MPTKKVRQQINQKTGETSLKKVNLEKRLTVFIEGRQITSDEKEKEQRFKEKILKNERQHSGHQV